MWVENKTVHLPQSGSIPGVLRNRTTLPAQIKERIDTEVTYTLQEFTSDPTVITDIDIIEVSYDKRQDVLRDHIEAIRKKSADYFLFNWCPDTTSNSAAVIGTTGSNRTTNAPGGTGNRKALTKADVQKLKLLFDLQEIPQDGRFLLLDGSMFNDILTDNTLTSKDYTDSISIELGTVGRLLGFNVMLRSSVGRMASGNTTAKDPDAANATSDNAFSLGWHVDFVRKATGAIKVYYNEDDATLYGSAFSAMARAGASKSYTNYRGVAALVEAP